MASFDYNPITGQLDLVGSGGASYIDGVVADPTALPVTLGTPALDSVFLAKAGSGVWLINRRPSGLYVRVANNGNLNDWLALGAFPEVNSSTNWELYDGTDPTKELKFNLSGISTGNTRTLTVPDSNGTIARTEDFAAPPAIGSTTRNTGAFTTLSANNGTLTASAPVLDLSQTWNNSGVTFTGFRFNVTNTNSSALSLFADFQVGGTTQFSVRRDGLIFARNRIEIQNTTIGFQTSAAANGASPVRYASDTNGLGQIYTSGNVVELLGTTTTSPQTFRLYNTFTDASNYERAKIAWSSNVLQIGTEKAGTGSARNLELLTDNTVRARLQAEGLVLPNGTLFMSNSSIDGQGDSNASIRLNPFSTGHVIITTGLLRMHGSTSSFPALKRSSTTLQVRLADDSAFAPLSCGALTLNGNLDASTRNIVTDTTTGTRIGTATTQLLGFWNAAPSAQPAAVADATDAASTQARLNDLLARLRTIGIIAT